MPEFGNFESDRHALFCGAVIGLAMKAGLHVTGVGDDNGDYLPLIRIRFEGLPDNVTLHIVVPPPPEDWKLVP